MPATGARFGRYKTVPNIPAARTGADPGYGDRPFGHGLVEYSRIPDRLLLGAGNFWHRSSPGRLSFDCFRSFLRRPQPGAAHQWAGEHFDPLILLGYLYFLHEHKWRGLLISAVAAGLSILTVTPGFLLFPSIGLLALIAAVYYWRGDHPTGWNGW